jgi:D-sedoheptulose 7-phosphate isomerase
MQIIHFLRRDAKQAHHRKIFVLFKENFCIMITQEAQSHGAKWRYFMGLVEKAFQDHLALVQETIRSLIPKIEEAGNSLVKTFRSGGKVLCFGNGGSATDAMHLEGELLGRFRKDREGLPAMALGGGIAAITAMANDYSYDLVFARLAKAHVKPEDTVMVFSTSGNSPNIIAAAKTASKLGASVIGLTGQSGGKLMEFVDLLLNVPSDDTPRIQELHIMICHILCDIVETTLFDEKL